MIESIHIASLGVIDQADIDLDPGLTVLTGETGAGKTMVLTSLQWLTGARADQALVRAGAERAEVDGVFTELPTATTARATELGVDNEDELILSRTVGRKRSNGRAGGRPVPIATLAELGQQLVTIHGQTDQLLLRQASTQREVLDALGDSHHQHLLSTYMQAFGEAVQAKRNADEARRYAGRRAEEIADLRDILDQLETLNPHAGEEDELLAESQRLTNVEDLHRDVARGWGRLASSTTDGPLSAADLLRLAAEDVTRAASMDHDLSHLAQRVHASSIEVDDIAEELGRYMAGLHADPERLAAVHERRAALRHVMAGRVADTTALMSWWDQHQERFEQLTAAEANPGLVEQQLKEAQDRVVTLGHQLSQSRAALATQLSHAVDRELAGLAMKAAHFDVQLQAHKPTSHGLEDIAFMLQAHPSAPARPLGQGASGGELSRIMLALEVVLGDHRRERTTFIFDEVDSGIGGRTALAVGQRLARLAHHQQVIVVTHLAQVAAFGSTHLIVEKTDGTTRVRSVTGSDRVTEIARMMSGDSSSEAARRHAEELLQSANMSESNRVNH